MIEEILKVSYLTLKNQKSGNFKIVKEELEMLGIEFTEDDLLIAFQIAQESSSIKEAIDKSQNSNENLVKKAKKNIKDNETETIKAKNKKKEEEDRRLNEKRLIDDKADAFNHLKNIKDYKICGSTTSIGLQKEVRQAIQQGYVPYGGVSTYNPGGKLGGVPDSFFQAMVRFK
tara:strand:+ start:677 stop:1195 length:519 start_codon:yes stop_codon:yes gene_type:complete